MEGLLRQVTSLPVGVKLASAVFGILALTQHFDFWKQYCLVTFNRPTRDIALGSLLSSPGMFSPSCFWSYSLRIDWGSSASHWVWRAQVYWWPYRIAIASLAGWFAIGFSRLYKVGDRIQIGEIKGDVIDIAILRTTLMETGNWVSRDVTSWITGSKR
jgi:hypothetical protein